MNKLNQKIITNKFPGKKEMPGRHIKRIFFIIKSIGICLFIINCSLSLLYSQETDKILAFPTSSELGNFGRTPVGLFTGTNQVSIPLYELKTKNLSFPINLNYSSNGFIVDKVASRYGYDWTLSAEGVVIRSIRGLPDDAWLFVPFPADLDTSHNLTLSEKNSITNYFNNWNFYEIDSEPDMYSFNFCGYSGQFYNDYEDDKIVTVPFQNLKISHYPTDTFRIIDIKGIQYLFEKGETAYYGYGNNSRYSASAYFITKIIHPLGDTIVFNYSSVNVDINYRTNISDNILRGVYDTGLGGCPRTYSNLNSPHLNYIRQCGLNKKLNSITTSKYGKILFQWEYDRSDFMEPRLSTLFICNTENDTLRSIKLYHQFINSDDFDNEIANDNITQYNIHDNEDYRMFLDSIVIRDKDLIKKQKYAFEYNNLNELPCRLSYAQDHWGYFNGANNSSLLPDEIPDDIKQLYFPTQDSTRTIADRSANYLYAQKGILSKIIFPTGGFTEYEYEAHHSIGHPNEEHGGVRLKQQRSYTSNGQLAHKNTYIYSGGRAGWDLHNPHYYYKDSLTMHCCYHEDGGLYGGYSVFKVYSLKSSSLYSLSINNGNNIGYERVIIYHGDSTQNTGKEEHEFEIEYDNYYSNLIFGTNENLNEETPFFPHPYINFGWENGIELKEKYYKFQNNSYIPVKEIVYNYRNDSAHNIINYYPSLQCYDYEDIVCTTPPLTFSTINEHFRVAVYWNISKWRYLSSKIEKEYNNNGAVMISDTTRYYYDNPNHCLLTRTQNKASNGETLVSKIRYPLDLDVDSGVYSQMASLNMQDYPVEQTTLRNSNVVGSTLTKYRLNSGKYVPDEIYSLKTSTPVSSSSFSYFAGSTVNNLYGSTADVTFNSYDNKGNIQQVTGKDGIVTSYLWGYNNTLPIVKAENVSYPTLNAAANSAAVSAGSTDIVDLISDIGYLTNSTQITKWKSFNTALRNHSSLQNAIVTTYSFKPMVGMISQTDPTGVITFYNYDSFGRLEYIKNDDSNLLKRFGYHYAGQ